MCPDKILFTTERMCVRKIGESDYDDMMEVYGDRDAMRWVGDGQPITETECREWIVKTLQNYSKRGYGMFAVEERHGSKPGVPSIVTGFCGIVHPDNQPEPEIKYAFKRRFWRQGLATEVVIHLLGYAQHILKLEHIIATVDPDNLASHRVLSNAGLQKTDTRLDADGVAVDYYTWNIVQ